jgi:hypothetical protein
VPFIRENSMISEMFYQVKLNALKRSEKYLEKNILIKWFLIKVIKYKDFFVEGG